jgi:hypothetical protein
MSIACAVDNYAGSSEVASLVPALTLGLGEL